MKQYKRFVKDEKGQAVVELALLLPIIFLIIMIIVYLGILTFSKCVVLLSAHEGGREALLIWNNSTMTQEQKEQSIRDAVARGLSSLPHGDDSDIMIDDDHEGNIHIKATYHFGYSLPFINDILGSDSMELDSDVSYRYATAPGGS